MSSHIQSAVVGYFSFTHPSQFRLDLGHLKKIVLPGQKSVYRATLEFMAHYSADKQMKKMVPQTRWDGAVRSLSLCHRMLWWPCWLDLKCIFWLKNLRIVLSYSVCLILAALLLVSQPVLPALWENSSIIYMDTLTVDRKHWHAPWMCPQNAQQWWSQDSQSPPCWHRKHWCGL